jgi:formylglycine-generating enzyme required for sulfatase activity
MGTDPKRVQTLIDQNVVPGYFVPFMRLESPVHRVRITRPFYLGVHEVSIGEVQQFLKETRHRRNFEDNVKRRNEFRSYEMKLSDKHPAINVSWDDALAFCKWLGAKDHRPYRLPTEAEWELACRAGSTTDFAHGDSLEELDQYAWTTQNAAGFPRPCGSLSPNLFGLYDMHGNVWEWCGDNNELSNYSSEMEIDPYGRLPGGARRFRGGSWYQHPYLSRSAARFNDRPTWSATDVGFRIACDADRW